MLVGAAPYTVLMVVVVAKKLQHATDRVREQARGCVWGVYHTKDRFLGERISDVKKNALQKIVTAVDRSTLKAHTKVLSYSSS